MNGVRSEWTLANNKNNELCQQVFGDNLDKIPKDVYRRNLATNSAAQEAFLKRKEAGLGLSDRVWNYTDQFKEEIEMGLDLGIRSGASAEQMSRELRGYLKNPDKLFRRVRDEHGQLQLSKNAKAYHPGRGVYRSSYKNALRLTGTETNIAYRTADYLRWQQMDSVVGIEVRLSNNHTIKDAKGKLRPLTDICDTLAGKYPKEFKFVGWHPQCRCRAVPIMKTQEEIIEDTKRILAGKKPLPPSSSKNYVKEPHEGFSKWAKDNAERIEAARGRDKLPYFVRDNDKYFGEQPHYGAIGAVTGTKLGRAATKAAFKVYEEMPAPKLTQEVLDNTAFIASDMGIKTPPKPMKFLDADDGRANISWGKGDEYASNCQTAVVVHEARLRGLNVTALGYYGVQGSATYELGEHFEAIWQGPKTGKVPTPARLEEDSFDVMLRKLEVYTKAQGRYHIGINMAENKGHVITAERLKDGRIIFYDAQDGAFLKLEEYADRNVEYFEVLKVDKLLLRPDIFKQIARSL